jgi:TolA-binding protein
MASEFPPFQLTTANRPAALRTLVSAAAVCLLMVFFVGPANGQQPPPPPAAEKVGVDLTTIFNTAVSAFGRGEYQEAAASMESLLKQMPNEAAQANMTPADKAKLAAQMEPIYFTLGAAYFNLKQYPEAIAAIKQYLTRYPKAARAAEATFCLAQASYFSKDYATAARGFAALENTPAFREQALLLGGLSYRELGEDSKAVVPLEKLIQSGIKSPTAARGAMQLVALYGKQKQPAKALKMLLDVKANLDQLENVVELNVTALEQGDAYLQNGNNNEALVCYRVVRTRGQVIAIERDRIAALQRRLEANKVAARANPKEAPQYFLANRQLLDSIAETQAILGNFEKLPDIYPKVLYRIGRAFYQMSRQWEAIVAYQDSYDRAKDPVDRELALFSLISANLDVNQIEVSRELCDQYLKEFPQGGNAFNVGYLLGATALQQNDPKAAESYFGRMLTEQPASTMREEMRFLLANSKFAQGKYDEAKTEYINYEKDYPQGAHLEEAMYRRVLGSLFAGDYETALKGVEEYLRKYPQGNSVLDAKYRLAVCKYALNKFDAVIADCQAWIKQNAGDVQQGEVQALLADAFAAVGKPDEALANYQASYKAAQTDEVLNYSLTEAGKILQKRGDWEGAAAMYQEFVKTHPEHPAVVGALAQIGRAKAKAGKTDEAKQFLAETLKKFIDDPERDSVEQILDQLAALCARKKPAAAVAAAASPSPTPESGKPPVASSSPSASPSVAPETSAATAAAASSSPAPEATPAPDPGAELDALLGASQTDRTPTAKARILYAKAQLARLRRQPAEADRNLLAIAEQFKPAALSTLLLGQVGDLLLVRGKLDEAAPFYRHLMDNHPKSELIDFAYNGLGEIAFQKKQYEEALRYFNDGTDKIAAALKLKDVTVGKAKTLLALNKLDEARKLFEQAASVREWRGETTAFCVYSLGVIKAQEGKWAEANAYFQRVYVAYQRFLPWVAKAYIASANALEKLGKTQDAINTYKEMLRNQKLTDFTEAAEARARLQALGAG